MKIVSIVLNNFTRDNRVLKENLSYKNAGFNPFIIALHEDELKEKDEIFGIEVIRIKLKSKNWSKSLFVSAFKYFEFLWRALKLTRNVDVIHCNDLDTLPIGFIRKKLNKKIMLIYDAHEHETYRNSNDHPSRLWLNKKMEKWFINSVDEVITVSDSIAEDYQRIYNISKPNLIYNCPNYTPPLEKKYNLFREKFSLRDNQKVFLYQGALTRGRGIDYIIEAFSSFENDTNIVVFMGYGKFQNKVISAAEKSNNIFYHPAVSIDEINMHSNSADWGLLTIENISKSYYYSLPNKLFEYAMAQIPILAFPTLEIKNKIEKFNIGIVSEAENVESLKKAIEFAANSDSALFKPGLKKMGEEFNWENQEKKLIEIIKS